MGTEILKAQQSDIIRQKEEKVYRLLLAEGLDKKYPDLRVIYIQEDVFLISGDKGAYSYCKENGEVIFNITLLRERQFVQEAMLASGFFEKKEGDVYKLYRVLGFDKNDTPVLEKTPINPHNKEYYKALELVYFNRVLISKTVLKKNPTSMLSREELKDLEEDIDIMMRSGAITIDDLEILLKQEKINKSYFDKAIKKIVEEKLLLQCGDERLDEAKQGITQEKLVHYYNKGYIGVGMAENCRAAIQRKMEKKQSGGKIGDATGDKLDELKK